VNTEHTSHLCSLVVVVCGRDRPSADPTVVDTEFRGFEIWRSSHHW